LISVCPALNVISSIFFTILYILLQIILDLVYIKPNFRCHFFHEAHFADTNCSYEYICQSDCETTYITRRI